MSKIGCTYESKTDVLNSNLGKEVGNDGNAKGFIEKMRDNVERIVGRLFNS